MQRSAGSEFAGYRLDAMAGRGGMGIVYRATQLALGRTVALKLIAPDYAHDPSYRERFERELRAVASLDHPNVIPVYHAGEEDGQLYVAMRWVQGTDLQALIARTGRLAPERSARIVAEVASALDYAHASGLFHRDIKPANVLIAQGASERVFLSDFGLSKHSSSAGGLTAAGQWVGTPDYVSPEQIRGVALDARGDVYSLGCVLFHALTGQAPYPVEGDAGKLWAHMTDPPPSATARVGVLAEAWDPVIARAMAKDPDERYGSAGELGRAALEAAQVGGDAHGAEETRITGERAGPPSTVWPRAGPPSPFWEQRGAIGASTQRDGGAHGQDPTATELYGRGPSGAATGPRPAERGPRTVRLAAGAAAVVLAVGAAAAVALRGDEEPPNPGATTSAGAADTTTTSAARAPAAVAASEAEAVLASYESRYSSGDVSGLGELLAPRFTHRFTADSTRDRARELVHYREEAARRTAMTLRVLSVRLDGDEAEANVRWRKRARTGEVSPEPGTPVEEAGGPSSEFRGHSRFRLTSGEEGETVIRRITTAYDLRLPVCAPPSRCAQIPGANGSVAVTATIDGAVEPIIAPDTFSIPRPEMRILFIPLSRRDGSAVGCGDVVRVSKRYDLVQTGPFERDSVFPWCP